MAKTFTTVYLAVGHGRGNDGAWDSGCVWGSYTEADLMLPIVKSAAKYLRMVGVTVYTDADNGNDKNIDTIRTANELGVDLYVSVHCDFYKAPSGTYPIVHPNSKEGYDLAKCINECVMEDMDLPTRGIKKDGDFWEVRDTYMPATIYETGSIKADIEKLKDSDKYGMAIAKGICKHAKIKFETTPGKWEKKVLWRFKNPNGTYVKNGWKEINGEYYYFDEEGWIKTGWIKDEKLWYYCSDNGIMLTGWQEIDGKKYFFHRKGGNMMTGWQTIDGKTYYFHEDGHMAKDETIGGIYYVDKNGVWKR